MPVFIVEGSCGMANRWPDGGEAPLTRGEKLVMGLVAVGFIAAVVAAAVLAILRFVGPRPTYFLMAIAGAIGVAVGLLWVRPWETDPPSSWG